MLGLSGFPWQHAMHHKTRSTQSKIDCNVVPNQIFLYRCIFLFFFFYSVRAANILSTTVLELDISCTRSHTTTLPPPTSTPNGEQITLEIDKQHSDIDFFFVIFVVIFLGLDPKYLTTVIPYHIENGTPDNPALQVLIKSKWNSIDYCRNVCLHYNKIVTI